MLHQTLSSAHTPCGYYKIRYYGIFASVHPRISMPQRFAMLASAPDIPQYEGLTMPEFLQLVTGRDIIKCPHCKKGNMVMQINSGLAISVIT